MIKPRPLPSQSPEDRACAALLRALRPHAGPFALIATSSRSWASATFVGARHRVAIALQGEDAPIRATRLQATLSEIEIDLAGGFVADILVTSRLDGDSPALGIEALTIDDPDEIAAPDPVRLPRSIRPGVRRAG